MFNGNCNDCKKKDVPVKIVTQNRYVKGGPTLCKDCINKRDK